MGAEATTHYKPAYSHGRTRKSCSDIHQPGKQKRSPVRMEKTVKALAMMGPSRASAGVTRISVIRRKKHPCKLVTSRWSCLPHRREITMILQVEATANSTTSACLEVRRTPRSTRHLSVGKVSLIVLFSILRQTTAATEHMAGAEGALPSHFLPIDLVLGAQREDILPSLLWRNKRRKWRLHWKQSVMMMMMMMIPMKMKMKMKEIMRTKSSMAN